MWSSTMEAFDRVVMPELLVGEECLCLEEFHEV